MPTQMWINGKLEDGDMEIRPPNQHKPECVSGNHGPDWSGSPDPRDPDGRWICDECGAVIAAA